MPARARRLPPSLTRAAPAAPFPHGEPPPGDAARAARAWPAIALAAALPMVLGALAPASTRAPLIAAGLILLFVAASMRSAGRGGARGGDSPRTPDPRDGAMLDVREQGDDLFHLVADDGRPAGWIRGATIRVGAFATAEEATAAAVRGTRALDDHLRGATHGDVGADVGADVRVVHDGAYEWVVAARRPLARLIRPRAAGARGGGIPAPGATAQDFALEFVVPASAPPVARVALARVLHQAVQRGLVSRGARPAGGTPTRAPTQPPPAA